MVYNRPDYPEKRTALKSIRFFCSDCACGQVSLVKECPDGGCALHPYRMGHNPARKGMGGDQSNLKYNDPTAD